MIYHSNYKKAGLEEATHETSGTFNSPLTLLDVTGEGGLGFAKTGYTFLGWSQDENATSAEYRADATFTMTGTYEESVDFYAVWQANKVSLTIETSDRGIDASEILVCINDVEDGVTIENVGTVRYDDVIRIDATNALVDGYDFAGFTLNEEPQSADGQSFTFTLSENSTVVISATPKTDSQIKVIYALRNLADTAYEVEETVIVGGAGSGISLPTGQAITTEFIASLGITTGADGSARYEGFAYLAATDNLAGNQSAPNFEIIYNPAITDESLEDTYSTVYILYSRLERTLNLSTSGDGVISFTATQGDDFGEESDTTTVKPIPGGEYSVVYGASVILNLSLEDGYILNNFTVTAIEAVNNVVTQSEPIPLRAGVISDGVTGYYRDYAEGESELIFTITETDDGRYLLERMPNYTVNITAVVEPIEFTVTYHSNYDLDPSDEEGEFTEYTTEPETWTYGVEGTIKNITHADFKTWQRAGYNFLGWAYTAGGTAELRFEETGDRSYTFDYATIATYNQDINLYAVWSAGEANYTVNFYKENLTTGKYDIASTEQRSGTVADTVSVTPTPDTGYEVNQELSNLSAILAPTGTVLNVYYKLIERTLTITATSDEITGISATSNQFGFAGSFSDGVYTATVKYGATVTLSAVVNEGYDLTVWKVLSGGVTIPTDSFTMGAQNVVIQVGVTPKEYTLTFDGDGGTYNDGESDVSTPYTQTFDYLEVKALAPNRYEKEGYTFAGWLIDGKTYTDGESFAYNYTENLTAVAQWTPDSNTTYYIKVNVPTVDGSQGTPVRIEMQGETASTITETEAMNALREALDELGVDIENGENGFEFAGFTEQNPTIGADGKTEVTANFTRINLSYTFRIDGAGIEKLTISYYSLEEGKTVMVEVTTSPVTVDDVAFGVNVTITPTFASGYEYHQTTEFRLVEGEEVVVNTWPSEQAPGGVVTTNTGLETGHIFEVTANARTFTLTYHDTFKGSTGTQSKSITYLGEVKIESVFSHDGYRLTGWATEPNGEKVYEATDTIESYAVADNLDLYAIYEANTYTIVYNAYQSEAGSTMEPTSAVYDTAVELRENTLQRTGYHFVGWAESAGGSAVVADSITDEDLAKYGNDLTAYLVATKASRGIYEYNGKYYAFNLTVAHEGTANLFPEWEVNTYTVYLNFDELGTKDAETLGTFTYEDESGTTDEVILPAFSTTDPRFTEWVNEGYEFLNWYYYNGDERVTLNIGQPYEKLTAENNGAVNVYINWTAGLVDFSIILLYQLVDGTSYDTALGSADNYFTITSDNYSDLIDSDEKVELKLETGTQVTPQYIFDTYINSKMSTKEGFTFDTTNSTNTTNVTIGSDGNTDIRLYFSRNRYDLYVVASTGIASAGIVTEGTTHTPIGTTAGTARYSVLHGATVNLTATERTGYENITFTSSDVTISTDTFTMPTTAVTVTASATAMTNINYYIDVFLADETNSFGEVATETLQGTGTTDAPIPTTDARAIVESVESGVENISRYNFNRFEYYIDESVETDEGEDPVYITTIAGDGSSRLKIYYTRKDYALNYNTTNIDGIDTLPTNTRVIWGNNIEGTFTLQAGYTFESIGAYRTVMVDGEPTEELISGLVSHTNEGNVYSYSFTMPAEDIVIRITTTANENTEYRIVYHYESTTLGTYDASEPIVEHGTTGEIITEAMIGVVDGTMASPEGFEYSRNDLDSNTRIAGDGSTVVNIYFTRLRSTLSLSFNDENREAFSNLQVMVNNQLVVGDEVEDSGGIEITTYTYEIAYGQAVEVSFDLAEYFEFDGFGVTGLTEATNPDELKVGEYTEDGTTLSYIHGLEEVEVDITIEAIQVPYTVRYFTQNVVDIADINVQKVENYSTEAVFEATGMAYINDNIEATIIKDTYIDGIAELPDYNAELFTGMNLQSYWYLGTHGNGETFDNNFIQVTADGTTVVNIYVNRQIVNINLDLDDNFAENEENIQYVYGAEATIEASTEPGYDYVSLEINSTNVTTGVIVTEGDNNEEHISYTFTLIGDNLVYDEVEGYKVDVKMTSTVGSADYTINVYLERIERNGMADVYGEPASTYVRTGTTGEVIDYSDLLTAPNGYNASYRTTIDSELDGLGNPIIEGDESSVVNIYFDLLAIYIEVELTTGIESFSVSGLYGSLTPLETSGDTYTYLAKYGEILYNFVVVAEPGYSYEFINLATRLPNDEWSSAVKQEESINISTYRYEVQATDARMTIVAEESDIMVYYDPNDGTPGVPETWNYGDEIIIRDNMFERAGYTFLGWATDETLNNENAEDRVAYRAGDTVVLTSNLTLYAVWQAETSNGWLIYLIIGLGILLLLIIIIIIIIVVKRKRDKERRKMASR